MSVYDLARVSVAVKKHHEHKAAWRADIYLSQSIFEGSQNRSLEAGAKDHGGVLLTGLEPMTCSAYFLIEA